MKLLIIALPKSASTSLQKFLCEKLRYRNANYEVRQLSHSKFFSATKFGDLFGKPNPLYFWHSDLFYSSDALISSIGQLEGNFVLKLHIGVLNREQFKRLHDCVDHILYCRRDVFQVIEAYERGNLSRVYPNLYGKKLDEKILNQMEIFLSKMDDYWYSAADEVIEFENLTEGRPVTIMQRLYDMKAFPKERFSRKEKAKDSKYYLRVLMFSFEKLLSRMGINVLYFRRFILGHFGKY